MRLLAPGESAPETIDAMLAALPAASVVELIASPEFSRKQRVRALLAHVGRHHRVPEPIEADVVALLNGRPQRLNPTASETVLDALDRLQAPWLRPFHDNLPDAARAPFLARAATKLGPQPEAREALRSIVAAMGDESFCALTLAPGDPLAVLDHGREPLGQARADDLIRGLATRPLEFAARLDALLRMAPRLRPEQAARVRAWQAVRQEVQGLAKPPAQGKVSLPSLFGKKASAPSGDALRPLLDALASALPHLAEPRRRADVLFALIDQALHPRGGFPAEVRQAIRQAMR